MNLPRQYQTIKEEIDGAISAVIAQSAFIGGEFAREFEDQFAEYVGASQCIGVANGTDALEIAIEALELPPGSEIIVPANSFIASAEAVVRTGHHVVFCDVNSDDYTLNIDDLKKRITKKTAGVIAVHLYGHPCDMDALRDVVQPRGIRIIEDCAQAHGATYKEKYVGTLGDVGCFSFYPGKNLGAYGDAGAIVTNDESLAKTCRMIANHGRIGKYDHQFAGRNSRLDGIQAAVLGVKLRHLDHWVQHRRMIAELYSERFREIPGIDAIPVIQEWAEHAYHLYVIRVSERDALREYLLERDIQVGIHYPTALPKLQAFAHLQQRTETGFAWTSDSTLLSLPCSDTTTPEDVDAVCEAIAQFSQ